jgi:ribosomal protein S18 acetylase RimI-like enzyme
MAAVRQARIGDATAIARIEVETWRSTYAGMLPDRVLLGMSERRQIASWMHVLRYRPETVQVVEQPRTGLLGFGSCGGQRDHAVGYGGEVYTLYVTPDAQGEGHGRGLLLALFGALVAMGHRSALIWVVRANPARFFYERLGGRQVLQKPIPIGGQQVEAVAYGWTDLAQVIARHAQSRNDQAGGAPLP